jgi:hypothetical protein
MDGLPVQIANVGANEFTDGITLIEIPFGDGSRPLTEADIRTWCSLLLQNVR